MQENINGRSTINVTLKAAALMQQDVVVVGYGTKKMKTSEAYNRGIAQGQISPSVSTGYYRDIEIEDFNREGYDNINENRFFKVADNPLSTYSIDVDAASYSNGPRLLNHGPQPPA